MKIYLKLKSQADRGLTHLIHCGKFRPVIYDPLYHKDLFVSPFFNLHFLKTFWVVKDIEAHF